MIIWALVQDLFFGERIQNGLERMGFTGRVAEDLPAAELTVVRPALLLVDLEAPRAAWEPLVAEARSAGVPVLAFGPHTDAAVHAAARRAGASRTVTKSKLTQDFAPLLKDLLERSS